MSSAGEAWASFQDHHSLNTVQEIPSTPEEYLLRAIFGDGPIYSFVDEAQRWVVKFPVRPPTGAWQPWQLMVTCPSEELSRANEEWAFVLPANWCVIQL